MKYGELTLGQIEAVVNKLGGMEGVKRFLSGESIVKKREREFDIWKTIKLGTGLKTADDFRQAFEQGGHRIGDLADYILKKPAFKTAAEKVEVDLVKVTVGELGFNRGAQGDQIYKRAKEFGLEFCPSEVGPQLRLQYQGQPNGEWILVAMDPIVDSDGHPGVFSVGCGDSGLWLGGRFGYPDYLWDADDPWVFCRPRK